MVADALDIHLAVRDAQSAVGALFFVQLDAQKRDLVEETVDSAQRTDEAAERPVDKDACDGNGAEERKLPCKHGTEHAVQVGVIGVEQQADRTAERARGADKFAERGDQAVLSDKGEGNRDHQHDEQDVLEIG